MAVAAVLVCAASSHAAAPAEPRPWNLTLRASASHDSNVPLAATDTIFSGERSSRVYGLVASGDYRLYADGLWTLHATGALQQTYNADSALREFDLTSLAPGVQARRIFRVAGRPALLSLGYAARRDWLGGSGFATADGATIDVGVRPRFSTDVGAFLGASRTDFDDDGPDPAISSRDGISYRAGVRAMQGFNGNRQALEAALAYVKNDADGGNFDFRGPSASLQFISRLYGPWAMAASAAWSAADYDSYAVPPRRESRVRDYRLVVFGPLTRKLSADLAIGRTEHRSNQAAFEARRRNVAVGITYRF